MIEYNIRYKKHNSCLYRKIGGVIAHLFDESSNALEIRHFTGETLIIYGWNDYEMKLGKEWVKFTHKVMETEAGQSIKLAIDI